MAKFGLNEIVGRFWEVLWVGDMGKSGGREEQGFGRSGESGR